MLPAEENWHLVFAYIHVNPTVWSGINTDSVHKEKNLQDYICVSPSIIASKMANLAPNWIVKQIKFKKAINLFSNKETLPLFLRMCLDVWIEIVKWKSIKQ